VTNPDELCICGHTHEVHFGHECSQLYRSGTPCPCKEFALCDAAVDIYEALKALLDVVDYCGDMMPDEKRAIDAAQEKAVAAIRKARGE
jgi:hypothetical protein